MERAAIDRILSDELSLKAHQVRAAIRLLDSGATVPFIARYRKEATGGMTDTHLRLLAERLDDVREIEKKRAEYLGALEKSGRLSPALQKAVEEAATLARLDDLYLPFRPKTRTRAEAAREAGLGGLAEKLLADPSLDPEKAAAAYVDPLKNVPDAATALSGARDVLVERFSEHAALAGELRERFWKYGWIVSSAAPGAERVAEAAKYADYFGFRGPVAALPSHRALAMLRGQKAGVLRLELLAAPPGSGPGSADPESDYAAAVADCFGVRLRRRAADGWLYETARQAWRYRIRMRLEIDVLARMKRAAEDEAVRVFAENLKDLLLAPPAGARPVLALDPGFRAGVKIAAVDARGAVADTATLYPHAPENRREEAVRAIAALVDRHAIELVAVGNGTASRETMAVAADAAARSARKPRVVAVSEAGASVYSASELASRELAGLDVTLRGAVSIARRLQDPLAELVKIDPKSVGVGQYQHDVNAARLAKTLRGVVEDCVNSVGVDVNTASPELLSYVAGMDGRLGERLVGVRVANGAFRSRKEVSGVIGAAAFEQAAGFLRVRGGENPLDASAVHPEAYPVVEKLLARSGKALGDVMGNTEFLASVDAPSFADERFGLPTVQDILAELERPGRDPRGAFRAAGFSEAVRSIDDVKPGMTLEGVVTNVAAFGAFVDVGVHADGLVHVSQLSDSFVRDPRDVVQTGQIVRVRVVDVDRARGRISLSLRKNPSK